MTPFCGILSLVLQKFEDIMACRDAIFLPNDVLHLISEKRNDFIIEP
jgi:hypothetical protein